MSTSQPSGRRNAPNNEVPVAEETTENQGRGPLHSLLNGIRVLESFSVSNPALGVNEIARRVDLHKSTTSRILATLQQADLVERDEASGQYRLGLGVIGLAGPLLAHLDIRNITYPALEELVQLTQETAALSVWTGHESIVVEQLPSPKQVKHTTPLGTRFTKVASATVQAFLAEQGEPEVRRLLRQGLVTAATGTEEGSQRLLDGLATVRSQGYALNDGDTDPEELSVAAPIRDHRSTVVAAVLLSVPRLRSTPFLVEDFIRRTCEAAQQVSARLGATSDRKTGSSAATGL